MTSWVFLRRGPLMDDGQELVTSADATGERGQLGVVEQVGSVDEDQEVLELLRGDGAEADQAVGGRHDRRQLDASCR